MDLVLATGPGGLAPDSGNPGNASSVGAALAADGLQRDDNKAATAHGILYAIVTLAVAPFDSLVAGALGTRWAWMHGITATAYFAFVIGAMVPGVIVSGQLVSVCLFGFFFFRDCRLLGGGMVADVGCRLASCRLDTRSWAC